MRILFTMTGSWGTGSGTVVEALTKEFVRRGHEVKVLYPERIPVPEEDEQEHAPEAGHEVWRFPLHQDGVELYTFPLMIADPNPRNVRGAWTFKDLSEKELATYISSFQERLSAVVGDFRPDVVECHHVWAMPYAASEMGLPYVAVAHHSDQMAYHYDERMRPYATQAAQKAARIFAVSESTRQEVEDLYGVAPGNVVVTGNGYDRSLFKPTEVDRVALFEEFALDIPADAPLVTFAGKLSKTKGVDTLLLANRRVQEERGDVHLIIFGTGELEDVLDEERDADYLLENVHFLGHRPYRTIARFHNVARLSVMPSRTEGFGIAGLEAMGCGLPLVITRTGGLDAHAAGAVVAPEDDEALADGILRIVNMPQADYEKLREQALHAASQFSWKAITEQRLKHYGEVAGGAVRL